MRKKFIGFFMAAIVSLSVTASTVNAETSARYTVNAQTTDNTSYSAETVRWLNWFNSLSPEAQKTINYRPAELMEQDNDITYTFSAAAVVPTLRAAYTAMMVTGGYELPYDPTYWNSSSVIDRANCYAYIWNLVANAPGAKLNPGALANQVFSSLTRPSIANAASLDASVMNRTFRYSSYSEIPGYREYKVALVIAPGVDFHWYRQNSDGTWSHKRGLGGMSNTDASGNIIFDPQTCNRDYFSIGQGANYSEGCGYFIVSY